MRKIYFLSLVAMLFGGMSASAQNELAVKSLTSVEASAAGFTVTTAGEKVKNLSSFIVNVENAQFANAISDAVLYQVADDGAKTQVAQAKWAVETEDGTRIFLNKAITKAGSYVMHFPSNYFSGVENEAMDIEYAIAKDDIEYTIEFTPGAEDKITELSAVNVKYANKDASGEYMYAPGVNDWENGPAVYFFDESGKLAATGYVDYPDDFTDWQSIKVNLGENPISAPGKYTMVLPDNAVQVEALGGGMMAKPSPTRGGAAEGDDDDDEEEAITYSPMIVQEFTVGSAATGINGVEANGTAAAKQVYTLSGIKVNGKAQKGVFIVNGKKVVLK